MRTGSSRQRGGAADVSTLMAASSMLPAASRSSEPGSTSMGSTLCGPNGDYHYHATDTFPYILGCYAGER